ncbi:hypothetical protein LZF95_13970 [Algoriphagus sp. AGSA1]|uniref:hypothetical protein n=1 Tax=Algoriphagus sp. AGSA1 TaxID=2907213 RepID=UPI001F4381D6|nr:hypothetical protein [Algoriphagus sp. AGSA1]MCE7055783.1 hypothetical protein [Algoriphagus sp. AGSA1]
MYALVSCAEQQDELARSLFNKNPDIGFLMVIPNAGCTECITTVEEFVNENKKEMKQGIIVFTGKISRKNIGRLGFTLDESNIYLDTSSYFLRENFLTVYPLIIYKNGSDLRIKEISPNNPGALDSLKYVLKTN